MFRNPAYLWWLPAVLGAGGTLVFLATRRRAAISRTIGQATTISQLIPQEISRRRAIQSALRLGALASLVLALAGPQWGVELIPTATSSNLTAVAVDVSKSMLAEDVKPNRLEKAKSALGLLLNELSGGRVGVVAFAGEAASICPITFDVEAAKTILQGLEPGAIPKQGTAIGAAIRAGVESLRKYEGTRSLVLLTDGEETAGTDPMGAAELAKADGVRVFLIGIGSPEGEPVPIKDESGAVTGYKKDKKGNTVVSRLGEETLKQIAAKTGGAYFRASPGENEVLEIAKMIKGQGAGEPALGTSTQYKNRFMIPLILAFLMLLAEMSLPERAAATFLTRREKAVQELPVKRL